MSGNPYDWTPEEVNAAWQAYANAPDTATKAELQEAMDVARADVRNGTNNLRLLPIFKGWR